MTSLLVMVAQLKFIFFLISPTPYTCLSSFTLIENLRTICGKSEVRPSTITVQGDPKSLAAVYVASKILAPFQGDPLRILEAPKVVSFHVGALKKFPVSTLIRSKVTGVTLGAGAEPDF